MEFTNDCTDTNFKVVILLGADAAYRFLGPIDEQFKEPFVQQFTFRSIVSGPLAQAIPAQSQHADSQ